MEAGLGSREPPRPAASEHHGLDEAGGDLYLQAFQVLVDNNLPKPGTGVKEEQKDYNPMDFW